LEYSILRVLIKWREWFHHICRVAFYGFIAGGPMAQVSMGGLLKDTALAGGALIIAGLYNKK
jgi:hypothetical protein